MVQKTRFFQKPANLSDIVPPELLGVADGQLESRALDMRQQDLEILGINVSVLGRAPEEVVRVLDNVLIERRAGSYQHRRRGALPPPRPARSLPA